MGRPHSSTTGHKTKHHKRRDSHRRSRSNPKHKHRPTSPRGRAEAARLLRSYLLSEMKGRLFLTREVREGYQKFKHLLSRDERHKLKHKVDASLPVRAKKKPRFYSDEKWTKGSGAVQRKRSRHLYDATDMKYRGGS